MNPFRLFLLVVLLLAGFMVGSAGRAMVADATTTDPNCSVTTYDVHLTNAAPGMADVDIYTEAACGVDGP